MEPLYILHSMNSPEGFFESVDFARSLPKILEDENRAIDEILTALESGQLREEDITPNVRERCIKITSRDRGYLELRNGDGRALRAYLRTLSLETENILERDLKATKTINRIVLEAIKNSDGRYCDIVALSASVKTGALKHGFFRAPLGIFFETTEGDFLQDSMPLRITDVSGEDAYTRTHFIALLNDYKNGKKSLAKLDILADKRLHNSSHSLRQKTTDRRERLEYLRESQDGTFNEAVVYGRVEKISGVFYADDFEEKAVQLKEGLEGRYDVRNLRLLKIEQPRQIAPVGI